MRQFLTLLAHRAIGLADRLARFGAPPPEDDEAEPYARTAAQEAPLLAELAVELQLRRIAGR
ncbi:hypothetical protein [Dactylosporangium sp. CA-092794]|uniref:hypothetical protein n=1 Tax=Dactylosporangium sp. CA-092794 TaxID=3239929 RepID=UPI003D8AC698